LYQHFILSIFYKIFQMKKIIVAIMLSNTVLVVSSFSKQLFSAEGAWHFKSGNMERVLILQDGYFSFSMFDIAGKKFARSFGGTYSVSGDQLHAGIEFDTEQKDRVGQHIHYKFVQDGDQLQINIAGADEEWRRVDDGNSPLAGNWRISGRMQNGQMQPIQKTARKTLKLLSGTRFQWMAINTETKEFFGTGGGTYTFKDGKYTENIEFFSRDSSRVGASLTFDGSVNDKIWTHKGLNSRGEPLHEEWTREK
jgi:hypothetical protein